jgi:exonuclease III
MKILNLNLWNYNDFGKRKPLIVDFLKKHNSDIITMQEVRDDLRFNSKGDNQAKQIKNFSCVGNNISDHKSIIIEV